MLSSQDVGKNVSAFPSIREGFSSVLDPTVDIPNQPTIVGPVFEPEKFNKALESFSDDHHAHVFGQPSLLDSETFVPTCPIDFSDRYLYPSLSKNERLRLTMLWYHTWDIGNDTQILRKLTQILEMVKQGFGWEIGIIGTVDANTFSRLVTADTIPLALVPRRESPCSHTINQRPGTVLTLPDMLNDWRFKHSPPVEHGGLRAYAGTQIRLVAPDNQCIVLGSLCFASMSPQPPLTEDQKATLVKAADLVSSELVTRTRMRRSSEKQLMMDLLLHLRSKTNIEDMESAVLEGLSKHYLNARAIVISVQRDTIWLDECTSVPLSSVKDGLWEDAEFIESLASSDETPQKPGKNPVRAIIGHIKVKERLLVIASSNIRYVFDDLDVWFVDQCAQVINNALQERYLMEALNAKENFLSSIRHELRTPIHGILTSVELLNNELRGHKLLEDSGVANEPSLNSFLRTIRSSATELMTTVNNMLRLNAINNYNSSSKTTDAVYDLRCVETDISGEVIMNYPEESLLGVSIRFENRFESNSTVSIDWETVKEILKALIFNSLAATPNGSIVVTTTFLHLENRLIFDIVDSGTGIQRENHERIFLAFEKVEFHSKGIGIGLSLASQMASYLKGQLSLVSSEPGVGSHFRLEIPNVFPAPAISILPGRWPPRLRHLPSKYHVIQQSQRNAHFLFHLEQYLLSCGFSQSDSAQDALILMNEPEPLQTYDCASLHALEGPHMIVVGTSASITPSTKSCLSDMLKPHIPWVANGPLYLARLDEIFLEADAAFGKKLRPAPTPRQPNHETSLSSIAHRDGIKLHSNSSSSSQQLANTPPMTPSVELEGLALNTSTNLRPTNAIKALLVDDNKVNLSVLQFYCKKQKYTHSSATNGNQAVSIFCEATASSNGQNPFTLILMDLQMPECDGAEATKQIREFEKASKLPRSVIFMITGQDTVSDRKKSFEAGVDEFFTKPVSMKRLGQAINRFFPSSPV